MVDYVEGPFARIVEVGWSTSGAIVDVILSDVNGVERSPGRRIAGSSATFWENYISPIDPPAPYGTYTYPRDYVIRNLVDGTLLPIYTGVAFLDDVSTFMPSLTITGLTSEEIYIIPSFTDTRPSGSIFLQDSAQAVGPNTAAITYRTDVATYETIDPWPDRLRFFFDTDTGYLTFIGIESQTILNFILDEPVSITNT